MNIASLNTGIDGEVLRQLEECIDTARRLGSEIVVVLPGFVSSRKFRRDRPFQRMVENLEKITETARDAGVKICLENLASKRKAIGVKIRELKEILGRHFEGDSKDTDFDYRQHSGFFGSPMVHLEKVYGLRLPPRLPSSFNLTDMGARYQGT